MISSATRYSPSRGDLKRSSLSRRDFLISTTMTSIAILGGQRAYSEGEDRFQGLDASYDRIPTLVAPRTSVGNVCGRVVGIDMYSELAASAPAEVVSSFDQAVSTLTSRSITAASSEYLDFRYQSADGSIGNTTNEIAVDVANDIEIAVILIVAMERDLEVGQALVNDELLSVSEFRLQMEALRDQRELFEAEGVRTEGGGAIYLPVQSRIERSGTSETLLLLREIDRLRNELARLQQRSAELSSFILRN